MSNFLSRKLRRLRRERRLTLKELGEKTGLSPGLISRYETGRDENPSLETLVKLARSLDVSVADFLPSDSSPAVVTPEEMDEELKTFVAERRAKKQKVDNDLLQALCALHSAKGGEPRTKENWEWLYRALETGLRMKE